MPTVIRKSGRQIYYNESGSGINVDLDVRRRQGARSIAPGRLDLRPGADFISTPQWLKLVKEERNGDEFGS